MKKIISILIAVMAIGVQSVSAQTPKVVLQHEGNVTLFESTKLQDAINAATEGDTLYLSEGTFKGIITLSKRVSLIGAGQGSVIEGSITISFTENDMTENHSRLLDALKITGQVHVTNAINDFTARKCYFTNAIYMNGTNTKAKSVVVDRCYLCDIECGSNVEDCKIFNSKLRSLSTLSNCITLQNCNIYMSSGKTFSGNLINSIVYSYSGTIAFTDSGSAINTLFNRNCSGNTLQNCNVDPNVTLDSSTITCNYSKDNLISKGYLGIDGTVVGIEGGNTPFTLAPNTPSVYDSNISVDKDSNKLNVTLKVKTE